jgi:hypothetical protein
MRKRTRKPNHYCSRPRRFKVRLRHRPVTFKEPRDLVFGGEVRRGFLAGLYKMVWVSVRVLNAGVRDSPCGYLLDIQLREKLHPEWFSRIKRSEGERRTGIYDYYSSRLHRLKVLHDITDTKHRRRLAMRKRRWVEFVLISLHRRPDDHLGTSVFLFVGQERQEVHKEVGFVQVEALDPGSDRHDGVSEASVRIEMHRRELSRA